MLAVGINLDGMAKAQLLGLSKACYHGHTLAAIVLMLQQNYIWKRGDGFLNQRLLGCIITIIDHDGR